MLKDAQIKKDAQISEEQESAILVETSIEAHFADEIALDKEAVISAQDQDNLIRLMELAKKNVA